MFMALDAFYPKTYNERIPECGDFGESPLSVPIAPFSGKSRGRGMRWRGAYPSGQSFRKKTKPFPRTFPRQKAIPQFPLFQKNGVKEKKWKNPR